MTRTELLELIRNGENSGVEFKRDTIENRALARELVAFANFAGGRVLLGVEDGGAISGTTRSNVEEWVMQTCRDKIRPELIPYFEILKDVEPGKHVAVVQVEAGWSVHHVWHDHHRTYYIRVGTTCREASQEELERLFQQRGTVRGELRPISGATLADLDRRRLVDYFTRVRGHDVPNAADDAAWSTLLLNTEIMSETASGRVGPTVAGMLLFGTDPGRFLPQSGVTAVAFPGAEKDYAARERATLRGPLVALLSSGSGGAQLVENGLVEQAVQFVRRNTSVVATLQDGARRVEKRTYPDDVIRETVVNALVHRDYLLSATDVELLIFADRLEVTSPGRLPNGITPARMLAGCRAARNQLIKDVMADYGYLEHLGMGVPRKIVKGMWEHNRTAPDLVEDGESFRVVLHAAAATGT